MVKVFPREGDVSKPKASSPRDVDPESPSFVDPLDVKKLHPDLIALKYDEVLGYDYTLALNKFNTLPDHVRQLSCIAFCVDFVIILFTTRVGLDFVEFFQGPVSSAQSQ